MAYEAIWAEDTSKLNKNEIQKLHKDGLDIIKDICETYANGKYEDIPKEEFNLFKWAGVYQQKPKEDGLFMMRVRIPSGILTSEQARTLAGIAKDFGKDLVDVTTRQAVQFHWLPLHSLPEIFDRLEKVGLSSFEACGDCPRTIIGNPLAGIDPDELMDTTEIVNQMEEYFLLNRDFSNLPRKYKMSVSANIYNAGHAEINDLAFTPAVKEIDGEEVIGFHVWVGGGLSAKPYLAQQLDMFVRPEQVLDVAIGVTTIFRDYGYREKRMRARLKFLVADWGPEKFLDVLKEKIGEYPARGEDKIAGWNYGNFTGVHKQKQPGLNYVGLTLPVGRTNAQEFEEIARLADTYGNGSIRTCNSQNVVLPNIPDEKLDDLLQEKLLERLTPNPKAFVRNTVSCTGNEFCNLAVVETKKRILDLAEYLDQHVTTDTPIRIHGVGCPNSCGQMQIADIGLQGALVKTKDGMVDAFTISVGGQLGPGAEFNQKLKGRVKGDDLQPVILHLVNFYLEQKNDGESFHDFVHRVGKDAFQEKLDEILANVAA